MITGGKSFLPKKHPQKNRHSAEQNVLHSFFMWLLYIFIKVILGQSLYLAAENISIKEIWTEAIHSTLSKIRLAQTHNI
jgi:hypothetical protein